MRKNIRTVLIISAAVSAAACAVTAVRAAGGPAGGGEPAYRAELIFAPGSAGFPSCHGSTLAELPNGDIIAAWYGGAFEKAKDVAVYAAVLAKGGAEWSRPWVAHDTPDKSEGNPVLWVEPSGALRLFYVTIMKDSWNSSRMFYKKSGDAGRAWGEPVTLEDQFGWMTRHKPLVIDDGTVLLPIYNEKAFYSQFMISRDAGETWKRSANIVSPGGNLQPSAVQLADGSLLSCFRTGSENGLLWWARSTSRGRKWTQPYTTDVRNPGAGADMVRLPNGHLALVFNDAPDRRNPLSVAVSHDEGKTWPYNRILDGGPGDSGSYHYPAVIAASDGMIHVTYTYNRDSIKHAAFNEAWVMGKE